MQYRREIDGLRAVAVVPVILFHAGFGAFGGGFVGVDVFFVISGYLITSIIIGELDQGNFSIVRFYKRRARRILPALFFVMVCCIPFAWMWMLPSQFEDFSQSLVAVVLFASNLLFWRESGYFDPPAAMMPLLHTWSLAVEEQYYILFPLALAAVWKLGRTPALIAIFAVALISLGLSEWGARNAPVANFFLAPTRVWELLAGSICAFGLVQTNPTPIVRGGLSLAGLGLVVAGIVLFDQSTPFPSLYALVPVIGTVLILLFGTAGTLAARMLSTRLLVGIGLISYSAYLWHQPLFAFARIRSLHAPSSLTLAAAAVLSIVLAYFSWRFVEMPFRRPDARNHVYAGSAILALILVGVGVAGLRFDLSDRIVLPPNVEYLNFGEKLAAVGRVCSPAKLAEFPGVEACYFGDADSPRTVALYGDSHAAAISHNLDDQFRASGIRGVMVSVPDCEIVPDIVVVQFGKRGDCREPFQNAMNFVSDVAEAVVVVSRWTFQLYPIAGHIDSFGFDNGEGGVEFGDFKEYAAVDENGRLDLGGEAKRAALTRLVGGLVGTRTAVLLVYPIPEIGWNIGKENVYSYRYQNVILDQLSVDLEMYDRRNAFVIDVFDGISHPNLIPIRPRDIFCDTMVADRCVAQIDGVPLYYDDDHLSYVGAGLVVDQILGRLNAI